MTVRLCSLAMFMMGSMSAICPNRWTGMIAFVLFVKQDDLLYDPMKEVMI